MLDRLISGLLLLLPRGGGMAPVMEQEHFRVRDDTNVPDNPPNWISTEDQAGNVVVVRDTTFRVRFVIANTGTGSSANNQKLHYRLNGTGSWLEVTASTPIQSDVNASVSSDGVTLFSNGYFLTAGTGTVSDGTYDENGTAGKRLTAGDYAEVEWGLSIDGAQVSAGDEFELRMYEDDTINVAYTAYDVTPTIEVSGTKLASGTINVIGDVYAWGDTDEFGYLRIKMRVSSILATSLDTTSFGWREPFVGFPVEATPRSGNLIVALVAVEEAGIGHAVTIPGFTLAVSNKDASVGLTTSVLYKISDGTEDAIVASWTELADASMVVGEFVGPFASSPVDKTAKNVETSSTASHPTGTTAAQSVAGNLAIASVGLLVGDGSAPTWSNSFASVWDSTPAPSSIQSAMASLVLAGTGAADSTLTDSGTTLSAGSIATFKADAGGGTVTAAGTSTSTGGLVVGGGQQKAVGTSTSTGDLVAVGVQLAFGTSTSTGTLAAIGSVIVPATSAAGTSTSTGDLAAIGTHLASGTSTVAGDLAGVGQSIVFAAGTITVSGDCVSRGTTLTRGTITMLGDTVSYATKLGAATTSYIGQLIAGGGQHHAAGTSTTIGDLAAIGTFVGGVKNAAGTISVAGTLVSDGKQLASGTSAFSANVAASGTQTASGIASLAGSLVAVGTSNATGTITALGDLVTIGTNAVAGTSTVAGDLAATSGRLFAFGISTISGDLGAIGIDLADTTKFAAGTSTFSGTITANSRTNGTGTVNLAGDLIVGGGQQSAIGTSVFAGNLVATGVDLTSGIVSAVGTILVGGGTGAAGDWTQQTSLDFHNDASDPSFTHGLSTQEGDLVCVYVHINAVETITAHNPGWIEEQNIRPDLAETCQTAIFWRRCTASEPTVYSFQEGYLGEWHVILHHFRPTSAKYLPVVDLAASADYFGSQSASLPCDAGNGQTISAKGVSLKFGGKDNRIGNPDYSTANNSYTGVAGSTVDQNTGGAYRIFPSGGTIPATLIGGSGQNDVPFSSHIAFIAQGAIGQLSAKGTSLAAGTSTSTGDLVASSFVLPSGTSTITGTLVGTGTNLARGTITALGDAVGYATKLAAGTSTVSGTLAAIGSVGEITATGTSTSSGDLTAVGTALVPVTLAAGTITISGTIAKHLPYINYGSDFITVSVESTNANPGLAYFAFGGWVWPIDAAFDMGTCKVATRDDAGDTYHHEDVYDPDGGTFGHYYMLTIDYISGDFFDAGVSGFDTTDDNHGVEYNGGNGGRWEAAQGATLYREAVFELRFRKSNSDVEPIGPAGDIQYQRKFRLEWLVGGIKVARGGINVSGTLTALGAVGEITATGTCNVSGDLAATGSGIVLSTATININGRALGIGHQRGLCNLRSATIKISGSLTAFEDPSDNVAPITASIGVYAGLAADLTHSADNGNLLAHASISISAYLDQAYLHKVSCINPTATFFVNGGIQSAGLTDPNLFLPTATINFSFQLSTGSIYLRDLPIIYFAELGARGRVLADGVAAFTAQASIFSTYGQIGPGTINGRKTAVINEPYGSITLYNNSQGAFYSTTGGQPLREARTTMIWSPTMSARGVKDQTKFAIGNFIAAGRLISFAPAPPAVGTITAKGSLSTSGDLTKFASGTSTTSATLSAVGANLAPVVNLSNALSEDETYSETAQAFYKIDNNGNAYYWDKLVDGYIKVTGDYVEPKSAAGANVHVRMTYQSGSTVNGPTGWVDTTIDRVWVLSQFTFGARSASYLAEISLDGGTTVEDSAVINFFARNNEGSPP